MNARTLSIQVLYYTGNVSYGNHNPQLVRQFLQFCRSLRVCPKTLGRIAEFSEHEAD